MLTFSGAPALSDFRLDRSSWLHSANASAHVDGVDTRFVHFVDDEARRSTVDETRVLEALLRYGPAVAGGRAAAANCCSWCRVSARSRRGRPRRPTSRTSAACAPIERIERGIAYFVHGAAAADGGRNARRSRRSIHDRMTESVLDIDRRRGRAVRSTTPPEPLATVPVLAQGRAALEQANARARPRAVRRRDRLPRRRVPAAAAARSDRRRTDDVRAGELRALPPQDLQRRLDHRRRAQRRSRCSA